ncbi:LOW QUALITY PROTEIN: short coiled-coil protein-like [Thomomys bottae]
MGPGNGARKKPVTGSLAQQRKLQINWASRLRELVQEKKRSHILRGRIGNFYWKADDCSTAGVSRSRSPGQSRDLGIPPLRRLGDHSSGAVCPRCSSVPRLINADMDAVDAENQVELEEKTRLINQVLELQHTLEDLSARVDAVKEENLKLKSENQVLGQYIENLMSASSVFQTTDTKSKRK